MIRLFAALLALSISTCQASDPLEAALLFHALDYAQTMEIAGTCHSPGGYHERNSALARCPSKSAVTRYFAGTAAIGLTTHYLLPENYRPYLSYAWLTIEAGTVARNYSMGLRFNF